MRDEYLKALKDALDAYSIENKEEILEKYTKRYDFGLESEMEESVIEQMLGNPLDIARGYVKDNPIILENDSDNEIKYEILDNDSSNSYQDDDNNKNDDNVKFDKGYNLVIKTLSDNIIVRYSDNENISVCYDNIDKNCYKINNTTNEGLSIEYYKTKYFSLNRREGGTITVYIPRNIVFDKCVISSSSGKIKIDEIMANSCLINIVSADVFFDKIMAIDLKFHTVSGDISGHMIYSKSVRLNTISGDFDCKYLSSDILFIDTVSGDCNVWENNASVKTVAISGDVYVNGTKNKNFKEWIWGCFHECKS